MEAEIQAQSLALFAITELLSKQTGRVCKGFELHRIATGV
jgi:hypothetical protein